MFNNPDMWVILKNAREKAGLTQEQVALKLKTKKSAVSRIENHAEDIKLSTLGIRDVLGTGDDDHLGVGIFNIPSQITEVQV